ncbi:MAG: metallopeptidase TldD-related protein [Myxococcota bacterium]|nr:metallopeptidase TldD-related protein [Myxococcota bacterium]
MNADLQAHAETAIRTMKAAGFDHAQAVAKTADFDELNVTNNDVNLFRTVNKPSLDLKGIVDGRKATQTIPLPEPDVLEEIVSSLFTTARQAPEDPANAISTNQVHDYVDGPLTADKSAMVQRLRELFDYRVKHTKTAQITEGILSHQRNQYVLANSSGSILRADLGCYESFFMAVGQKDGKSSSMGYSMGTSRDLEHPFSERFGTDTLLEHAQQQIETTRIRESFNGSILLSPMTVMDLVAYLQDQVGDGALLTNSSMYKDKVGEVIAAKDLSIFHTATAPGSAPHSTDGYVVEDFPLVEEGRLETLLPTNYASRKCDLSHKPNGGTFSVRPGGQNRDHLLSEIQRGALVGRLSMGRPAVNGDFSGVIKNSFTIAEGKIGPALSETMISGNVAQMLKDIDGISLETINFGGSVLPWIRIPHLVFS